MIQLNDKVTCSNLIVLKNSNNEQIHIPAGCQMEVVAVYPSTDSEFDLGERSKVMKYLPYPDQYTSIVPNEMLTKV